MAPPDTEVLQTLVDVGDGLLNHPSSTDQLLALLDKLENILSTLDQEPDDSVKEAILPSMKALISSELLRHSDEHVKISVTSCIAEITRITAPDAPYGDENMKEIFKLTVEAFEKLSDEPSRIYDKALLIVNNVARVRSCLLMMDLECDDLIVQMFQIFLGVIRPNHPEVVTLAIEAIMTMVLDESEEISTDLLRPILDSVRKENQTVSPVSWSLADKVLTNCADKLQPYLMRAVQSTGRPLDAFAEVVVSICQRESETLQCNHSNGFGNPLCFQVQAGENEHSTCKNADGQYCDDQEPDMTCARHVVQNMDDAKLNKSNPGSNVDCEIIEKKSVKRQPHSDLTKNEKRKNMKTSLENGNSKLIERSSSEAELDVMPNKRSHKPNSLMNPEEGHDHSQICMGSKSAKAVQLQKESENVGEVSQPKTGKTMKDKKARDRVTGLPPSKNSASQKDKWLLEPKNAGELSRHKTNKKSRKTFQIRNGCDNDIELSSPASHDLLKDSVLKKSKNKGCGPLVSQRETDKNIDATNPSMNQSTPSGSHRKRGRPRKNSITNNLGSDPRSVSMTKEDHSIAQHEDICLEPASLKLEKDLEVMKNAEVKNQARPKKIKVASKTDENTAVITASIVGEVIGKPCEDEKATPVMNIETTNTKEDRTLTQTNVKKRRKLNVLPNKDVNDSYTIKQLTESVTKKLTGVEETSQTRSRRKRSAVCDESSEMQDYNEPSVGSRIKVWWPMDKRFYEGVVDSYDSAKGKHKILYADGDVEVLNLKKQRWELITDHASPDADQEIDLQQIETVTSDTEDKRKVNSSESVKGLKTRGRASARISKSESAKSARKSKEDDSVVDEPVVADESAVTKIEQDSAGKSKNRRLKIISNKMTKPKDNSAPDEPIVANESADDPPRTKEQDFAGKSKAKRSKVLSDKRKIEPRNDSALDEPIEVDDTAVDPPTANEQDLAGKSKTILSKILSDKREMDNSAPDEPIEGDDSAVDPHRAKSEQDSEGRSKTKRGKIFSDNEKIEPKDYSVLDEHIEVDDSAVDPPSAENEQDLAGKSRTKRSKILFDKEKIKTKDDSALDEPIEVDDSALDPPRIKNEQETGKSKTRRSNVLSDKEKIDSKDDSSVDKLIEADDDSAVDPPRAKNKQDSAGKSKTKQSKILSDKEKIEPRDNSALDEPIEADGSAVDLPRTKNEQETGKSKTRRSKILSDKKTIRRRVNSALDEPIEAGESADDPPRTKNEQDSTGKSRTRRSKILSDKKKIEPKDDFALDEPIEAGESADDPPRTKNEEDPTEKSRTRRSKILSDKKNIELKDDSELDEPIEAGESADDPPRNKNEQDSTGKSKTRRSKFLSDKKKIEPKDDSALDEPIVVDESAVDPPRTSDEQDSAGKSKTRRPKIISDKRRIEPKDDSALDEPIVADESAVDPPRTSDKQDSAGKSKTRRSKILSDKKKFEPKDNSVLGEPNVADEPAADPPKTNDDQASAGKAKTRRSKILFNKKKVEPKDNSALDEPNVADEPAVDPPRTNDEQDSAGKVKTRRSKILSNKKKIEPKDNSTLDESTVADESAVDAPRANDEQDLAGKSTTKRLIVVSDKKRIKPRDDSALDEPIEADESAVDPPQTNNEQELAGKSKTKRLKIVSGTKKIELETDNVQKSKLRKA